MIALLGAHNVQQQSSFQSRKIESGELSEEFTFLDENIPSKEGVNFTQSDGRVNVSSVTRDHKDNFRNKDAGSTQSQNLFPEEKRPNIVFVLADDLGWHDVGYHGSIIDTPNIDHLAAEGVKLENYYVSSWCAPSRVNLLTGRYRIRTGLYGDVCDFMGIHEITLADKLYEAGYYTAMVGKWHLSGFQHRECYPAHRGFQTFLGFHGGSQNYFTHRRGGSNSEYDFWANDTSIGREYDGRYSTMVYAEEAQRIIRHHRTEQPLFLYLSFQAVHSPLLVPSAYEDKYRTGIEDDKRRVYAAMTSCMDEAIGNVTDTLKETGLWNKTVFIFSSDNGGTPTFGGSNWPLRGRKGLWYEGGIRAVGFVNSYLLSNHVTGSTNHELIHITDWFPTLLRLAKTDLHRLKPLDGIDQWETISQGKKTNRKEVLLNFLPGNISGNINENREGEATADYFDTMPFAAIRVGDWKLLTGNKDSIGNWEKPAELGMLIIQPQNHGRIELYNVKKDPEERENMADENTLKVHELLLKLKEYSKLVNNDVRLA
ncbi:arylsulfatase I-like [Saccoglossus kowalevskii]